MTTPHEEIIEKLHAIHTDLQVHIAKDEGQWAKVAETEEEIKHLAEANGKVKTKQAVIVAILAASGTHAFSLLKALL
jgi:hypothetical protein